MKKVASSAKSTAINVAKAPQLIGRTILSVPKSISKLSKKDQRKQKPKHADRIEFISKEILDDQGRRRIVRESQSDTLTLISTHLESFLAERTGPKSDSNSNSIPSYEEWIADLHPDNAEYADGSIDHRFYVEESDHRILWNDTMMKLGHGFEERVVNVRAVEPNYNRTN